MRYAVTINQRVYTIEVRGTVSAPKVILDGKPIRLDLARLNGQGNYSLIIEGKPFDVEVTKKDNYLLVYTEGKCYTVGVEDERVANLHNLTGFKKIERKINELRASMPGLVVAVEVRPGDVVQAGQGLIIIEAMKMENQLKAIQPGRIKEVKVKPRQTVDQNQVLIVFE